LVLNCRIDIEQTEIRVRPPSNFPQFKGYPLFSHPISVILSIVLYLFRIPTDPYTGKRTSYKPQDIESVIAIQYKMFQQRNLST
jgi:hypothetical protein